VLDRARAEALGLRFADELAQHGRRDASERDRAADRPVDASHARPVERHRVGRAGAGDLGQPLLGAQIERAAHVDLGADAAHDHRVAVRLHRVAAQRAELPLAAEHRPAAEAAGGLVVPSKALNERRQVLPWHGAAGCSTTRSTGESEMLRAIVTGSRLGRDLGVHPGWCPASSSKRVGSRLAWVPVGSIPMHSRHSSRPGRFSRRPVRPAPRSVPRRRWPSR
jgi:hypothetical protein